MLRHIKKQLTAFEYACNAVERKGMLPVLTLAVYYNLCLPLCAFVQ